MRRLGLVLAGTILLAGVGAVVVHIRRTVVPPGCRDPQTLAQVRDVLVGRYHLPETVRIENIAIQAGGPLAFRFVCTADLGGLEHVPMPPGPVPGGVRYVTRLTGPARRLQVTVSVQPLLTWIPVQ
ncbi:MAG: hypothetical protein KGL52_01835 [Rhodospirillales bacterium]|jgi:hypothetical protein|nr:hypothetical protein [Rhodospirillales bacterium]